MAGLILTSTRLSQPPGGTPLNGLNPIARDLACLWSSTHGPVDLVSKRAGSVTGTWVGSPGPAGIGNRSNSGGTNRLELAAAPASANSTSYTVFAYVHDDAGSGSSRNPIDCDRLGARVFQLRFTSSDGVEFITFDNSGNPYFATGGAISFAPRSGLLVGRIDGNSLSVWWKGVKYATGTASGTAATIASNIVNIGATYGGTSGGLITGYQGQVLLGGVVNRALSDLEIQSLSAISWQCFADDEVLSLIVAGGGGSHAATGSLVAGSATIAGAALHPHTSTGALVASAATIAGTAAHLTLHTSTGALAAGAATISGAALHPHAATGALVAGSATISGAAARATAGTHAATGALVADAATIAGSSTHLTLHTSTGALAAGSATLSGIAEHLTTHAASGSFLADAATISGTAARASPSVATVTLHLVDKASSGVALPSLTGLRWAFYDTTDPSAWASGPVDQGSGESTDGSGDLVVSLPNTTLTAGQVGWLIVTDSDGTVTQSPPCRSFCGPVTVA